MKKTYKIITVFAALSCASSMAFGSVSSNDDAATVQQLQSQLSSLQTQIKQLETKVNHTPSSVSTLPKKTKKTRVAGTSAKNLKSGIDSTSSPKKESLLQRSSLGNAVIIAPFTSKPTFYSGGQLVVNAPSINEDAKLLYRRYLNEESLLGNGKTDIPSPRLVLSGKVEAQAIGNSPYYGTYKTDVDLSGAEFDTFAEVTPWVNGFLAFSYDNTAGNENRRISNSKLYLDKGFVTIGNFHKSSFYGSIGQMYVPFGRYESSMVSDPLTKYIGKTKARAISISYTAEPVDHRLTPYARVFGFKGDTKYGNSNLAKQGGVDAGLWYTTPIWNGDFGASYIDNLADSDGMQKNGVTDTSHFEGFNESSSSENLVHGVRGVSLHFNTAYRQFNLLGEYIAAIQQFSTHDMSYNSHGAKPRALNVEGAYSFKTFHLPSTLAIGYGMTREALALNLPRQRYIATYILTCLTNTTFSLEFRHDMNYSKSDKATAGGDTIAYTSNELGHNNNVVTAQIGVYF